MAYGVLSVIPGVRLIALLLERDADYRFIGYQELSKQYQRDDNVRSLIKSMHDAFDFESHEETLKSIEPESKQAEIITQMLRDVCSCSDFIQSYTKDSQFCRLFLRALSAGQLKRPIFSDAGVEEYGQQSGGQDPGLVHCPCRTSKSFFGPHYHYCEDNCVPNFK